MENRPQRILTVCLGNICRSPIAHGLLIHHAENLGLHVEIDSAGTISNHAGSPPDSRSIEIMTRNNHDISSQRSRIVKHEDFEYYDLILAMDKSNYEDLCSLASNDAQKSKINLVLPQEGEVPDPYYGGDSGFESVYKMLDEVIPIWLNQGAG
ncbi:MAG: low molecular weight phosphotyrosine protein phosphatase [Bacteroidetes bacterium]|jgi:protein-tyrosine phosphatase|nr:low molecular weight phosphotyrosine protein phosphatase [Bacteroidota bacterium]MDA0981154.1 low molecular weight phosphotyrosine protein phosphatase [Bacteroidota bacterium]|tara:strand:+ start:13 stop:471 length:459 start_codon:yes stop_codon:yes gene_type:complete